MEKERPKRLMKMMEAGLRPANMILILRSQMTCIGHIRRVWSKWRWL